MFEGFLINLVVFMAGFFLGFVSMLRFWPDPYHFTVDRKTFWEWLYAELDELINGEK